jgi:hypothetical protein
MNSHVVDNIYKCECNNDKGSNELYIFMIERNLINDMFQINHINN